MNDARGGISRRELLLGTAAAGGIALAGLPGRAAAQSATATGNAAAGNLDRLAARLHGDLITPAHAAYDEARRVWNGMIDKRPAAIAGCTGVADVVAVVDFARDNGIPVTIRGGGHNVAGKAVADGAITIDLGPMRGVWVNPAEKRALAQGGVRWTGFDRETVARGLVTTGGTVGATGIAGLTLGGGIGWLARKHGLSCDNLVSAEVVTADGRVLRASADENDDLYWALRGGGGNFGVVTTFEFQLHGLEPITGGIAMYPENRLGDMLRFYRDFTAQAPDAVTTMAGISAGPPGSPLEGQKAGLVIVCHKGPAKDGERLLRPIKAFGPPAIDTIGPTTYTAQQQLFDAAAATNRRHYWRSNFMRELSDGAIANLVARAPEIPSPETLLLIEHLGGAVGRVGAEATAYSNRGALYNVSILASWTDAADDPANIAWTRSFGDELRSYSTGGAYVNYMAGDASPETVKAAYEANFERLVEVKRRYDPDNFWSGNQNIAP